MTAKEFVLQHLPTAAAESHRTREMARFRTYWLIREKGQYMYFAEGETQSKAWVNAKKRLQEKAE